jgi:hypothetical protein
VSDLATDRHVNGTQLAAWRKRTERGRVRRTASGYYWTDGERERAVSIRKPKGLPVAENLGNDTAGMGVEPLSIVRRDAREIRDALTERRIAGLLQLANRSPEFWSLLYDEYIKKHRPELTIGRTKEEAIRLIVEHQNQLSVERVFKKKGRGVGHIG